MKKIFLIGFIIFLLVAVALWILTQQNVKEKMGEATNLPVIGEVSVDGKMETTLQNGQTIRVNDITALTNDLGDGTYAFVGGLEEIDPSFTLSYFGVYDFYQVSINAEPIAEVREEAEQELQAILGVSEETMCQLQHSVMTSVYVNSTYGGVELGFSFCPGSVQFE